jgi:hypothetical protein
MSGISSLLDFPVHLVLAAFGAELLQFEPLGLCFLVFSIRIVAVFALSALHRYYFAHLLAPVYRPGMPGHYGYTDRHGRPTAQFP